MPKTAKTAKEVKAVLPFSAGDFVVYPAHGVGKVTSIEAQTIAGQKVDRVLPQTAGLVLAARC